MKRRITSVFLSVLLLFVASSLCFADDFKFKMFAEADSMEALQGETVSVIFYANSISDSNGLLSLTADVQYDATHLKLLGVSEFAPENWEDTAEIFYNEKDSNGKKVVCINLLYDGDDPVDKGAKNDNEFGFKLDFSVETADAVLTTVEVLTEGLPGTGALSATSGLPELKTIFGEGVACTINLNNAEEQISSTDENESSVSDDLSTDASEIASEDASANESEASADSSVDSNSNGSLDESQSAGETSSDTESATSGTENVVSATSNDESEVESKGESQAEEKEGINVILLIVIACAVIAASAFGIYVVKNKKDDMNPVNPG